MDDAFAVSFGAFRLDPDGSLFRRSVRVHLTPKELALLRLLVAAAGAVVTKDQILAALWPDVNVSDDSLTRCVYALRRSLSEDRGETRCVETVARRGYRLALKTRAVRAGEARRTRVAVLPFAVRGEGVEAYLGEGLAQELIQRLGLLRGRGVDTLAWATVAATPWSADASPRDVARAYDLDFVVTGVVRSGGERLRVAVEMVDLDGVQAWSELVERPLADVASIEADIAAHVAQRLPLHDGPAAGSTFSRAAVAKPLAYHAYLRALHARNQSTGPDVERALAELQRAIGEDPAFAAAHAALGDVYAYVPLFGVMRPAEAAARARAALGRALALDPGLAAAYAPLGYLQWVVDWDPAAARESFETARRLDPASVLTKMYLEIFLTESGEFDAALEVVEGGLQLDPGSPHIATRVSWVLACAGRHEEALARANATVARFPYHLATYAYKGVIEAMLGRRDEALATCERLASVPAGGMLRLAAEAYIRAACGQDVSRLLPQLEPSGGALYVPPALAAPVYVALGDTGRAFAALEEAVSIRCWWLGNALVDPRLEPLHDDPRWAAIVAARRGGAALRSR